MVRIRFRRVGARNQPSFRIVAADKDSPRDGRFLEVLGSYNPRTHPSTLKVDEARLFHWMSQGAQPSDSVVQTLQSVGTWERWERFKGGEDIEKLEAEAQAAMPDVDPRTRRDDIIGQRSTKRRKHAEAEPKAEAEGGEDETPSEEAAAEEPAEEPAAEAEAEAEAEADAGAESQADEAGEAEAESEEPAESAAESEEPAEAEAEEPAGEEGEAEADEAQAAEDEAEAEGESE